MIRRPRQEQAVYVVITSIGCYDDYMERSEAIFSKLSSAIQFANKTMKDAEVKIPEGYSDLKSAILAIHEEDEDDPRLHDLYMQAYSFDDLNWIGVEEYVVDSTNRGNFVYKIEPDRKDGERTYTYLDIPNK